MIYIEDTIVEIEAGTVDDRTAQEVYRNLQVLYGTETGEQALDREFGIDINVLDNPQEAAKALLAMGAIGTGLPETLRTAPVGQLRMDT